MLSQRSHEKELLDLGPDYYNHAEYTDCLKKLFHINRLLGCFRDTVKRIKLFANEKLTVLDIGCGGGLFLLHLNRAFPHMPMIGMDISMTAIKEAQSKLKQWKKKFPRIKVNFQLQKNVTLDIPPKSVDIIISTLVCHHLEDDSLSSFLQRLHSCARKQVIIHDLHRHYIAYWFYKLFSPILFRNRLITHDGLISIKRGFTRKEWHSALNKAGLTNYTLKWCFPFRWQLILFCRSI